jgi:hypothetical protein
MMMRPLVTAKKEEKLPVMGRPRLMTEEKDRQLLAALRMKPTLKDAAALLEVSEDTILKHTKEKYGVTFTELREQKMVATRHSLIRTAIQQAESGNNNVMLIFCLKNLCGWKDKHEVDVNADIKPMSTIRRRDGTVVELGFKGEDDEQGSDGEVIEGEIVRSEDRSDGELHESSSVEQTYPREPDISE